jgi:tRNA A-37 threonylcarbamoyl transferase component Bud32/tetratricopeptide (TPR) repeat protein
VEPREFGKFTLLEHVGKGGMGTVYRAFDNETGRIAAVKTFLSSEERPPELSRKLRDREVRMLIIIRHPNIVRFFETGHIEDDYYYTMEFVEHSLLDWMREGRQVSLLDRIHILRQVADALAAIHRQGIVHRDVKPGNILLDQTPSGTIQAKLTDLGIAKSVSEADIVSEQTHRRIPGTPKYLSPEQILQDALDGRSDVFGLGVLAYELLTGTNPFLADDTDGYFKANVEQQQKHASTVDGSIPRFLGDMVDKMLAKDREERYDSEALARDLELVQQHLISGAPLRERTNPASIFYEPPPELARRAAPPAPPLSGRARVLAAAVVLAGAAVTLALWPRAPVQPGSRHPDGEDLLLAARAAAESGQRWFALALLQRRRGPEPDASLAARLAELSAEIQESLAGDSYGVAQSMLQAGRREEAEVVLQRIRDMLPESSWSDRLAEDLERPPPDRQDRAARVDRIAHMQNMARHGRFAEALDVGRELRAWPQTDPEAERSVQQAVVDVLDLWSRSLVRSEPERAPLEQFFLALDEVGFALPGGPGPDSRGRLRLQLAEVYRDEGEYDLALRQLELAAAEGDAGIARLARSEQAALRAVALDRPLPADEAAEKLAANGFRSSIWWQSPGGEVQDGVLRLSVSPGKPRVARSTARPIRNLGFQYGVQFRIEAVPESPAPVLAGIGVEGRAGDSLTLAFDGRHYRIALGATAPAQGPEVAPALGDEPTAWHALSLDYDFSTGRLSAGLDGRQLAQHSLDLADLRLSVFAEAPGDQAAAVLFRDVYYRPR